MAPSRSLYIPTDFLNSMKEILPDGLSMETFLDYCARPLRRSIRVNTLKISVNDFLARVAGYGWQLTPIPWCPEGFWIERDDEEILPLGSTAEHISGLFYIQEASSMLPVAALFSTGIMPGRVMDMAAAPGSKTTQIAARMANQGMILANEFSASRVKVLHANISRCGIVNTAITHFDGRVFGAALPEVFDAILLDAPCSGEGVIRKDPDALKNWSLESTADIAATQRELIDSAFHALRPGGTLVYSTCTLNRTENQAICQWLQTQYPDAVDVIPLTQLFPDAHRAATPEGYLHVFPSLYDCEGFFVACLRKTASIPALPAPRFRADNFPFTPVSKRDAQSIAAEAARVGLPVPPHLELWQRDNELWLFASATISLFGRVRFSRPGIKLAERHNKGLRWQHESIVALGDPTAPCTFTLTSEQAQEWYRGRDIYPDIPPSDNEVLMLFQGQVIGQAKRVGSRLKNAFPRELVRDGKLFSAEM